MGQVKWLWTDILKGAGAIANALLYIIGNVVMFFVKPLLNNVVLPLLNATIFHPFTLAYGSQQHAGEVGNVAHAVWFFMIAASAAIAFASLLWGIFLRTGGMAAGGQARRWGDLAEGLGIWLLTVIGGYTFLALLLSTADIATKSMIANATSYLTTIDSPALGVTAGAVGVVAALFYPTALLLLMGVMVWMAVIWLMRQVDLIFYTGLVPIMAAIAVSGNKQPFHWAWSEALGAIFSQLAMAVTWWMAVQILLDIGGTASSKNFMPIFLGVAAMTLVAKAPSMLTRITGHQYAGVGGMMMAVAGGSLLASAAKKSLAMSPGGQAVSTMAGAQQQRAADQVGSWANHTSVGERLGGTKLGQKVKGGVQKAADLWAGTRLGQGATGASVWAHNTPGVRPLARGADGVGQGLRTAASMVYQPRTTLGRMTEQAYGTEAAASAGVQGRQMTAQAASVGVQATQDRNHLHPETLQNQMGAYDLGDQQTAPTFQHGAPQQGTYDRVQRAQGTQPATTGAAGTWQPVGAPSGPANFPPSNHPAGRGPAPSGGSRGGPGPAGGGGGGARPAGGPSSPAGGAAPDPGFGPPPPSGARGSGVATSGGFAEATAAASSQGFSTAGRSGMSNTVRTGNDSVLASPPPPGARGRGVSTASSTAAAAAPARSAPGPFHADAITPVARDIDRHAAVPEPSSQTAQDFDTFHQYLSQRSEGLSPATLAASDSAYDESWDENYL